MTAFNRPVFADTLYWVGLVSKRDQHHARARKWSLVVRGLIVTTEDVLIETANSLTQPPHRGTWLALLGSIRTRPTYRVVPRSDRLLDRGWLLYAERMDKEWSLTDCISFLVMGDQRLTDALTADHHFRQAGFVPLLQSDPPEAAP